MRMTLVSLIKNTEGSIILRGPEAFFPERILENYVKKISIFLLSGTSFRQMVG